MIKNGFGHSGHGALKLIVFQEWTDGMNWFFACWCKFRKAKSNFNDFWVCVVIVRRSHLVHATLKSAVFSEWVFELSWFFACRLWCSNFWLDRYPILYLWLLNASLLQLHLVCPFFLTSVCPGFFLEYTFPEIDWVISRDHGNEARADKITDPRWK